MKTCPHCNRMAKRRKARCCPHCGKRIEIYRPRGKNKESVWTAETKELGELVDALEELIRIDLGLKDFKFEDRVPQLGMARSLYEKCGFSQSLALEVINAYFEAPHQLIWYRPRSMAQVIWDSDTRSGAKGCFSEAIAYARSRISREMHRHKRLQQEKLQF